MVFKELRLKIHQLNLGSTEVRTQVYWLRSAYYTSELCSTPLVCLNTKASLERFVGKDSGCQKNIFQTGSLRWETPINVGKKGGGSNKNWSWFYDEKSPTDFSSLSFLNSKKERKSQKVKKEKKKRFLFFKSIFVLPSFF